MSLLDDIIGLSKKGCPRIVLPEGADPRVVQSAKRASAEGLARITLLDTKAKVGDTETGIEIINPAISERLDDYSQAYFDLRKHKGITLNAAQDAMMDPLGYAAMMVRLGDADGTLGGAVYSTSDTVRSALQIIGKAKGSAGVSSYFLMLLGEPFNRPVVFADCGLVIDPTASELAGIAIASAASFEILASEKARVALLSFSTLGSAAHASVDKVKEALKHIRQTRPDLTVDGELQFDAALLPQIAERKAKGSPVAGSANVFVFPDLNSGNIGYKIAERLGRAVALGPILQGLARPANDLSRGCSEEDIYQMIAITGAQAAAQER